MSDKMTVYICTLCRLKDEPEVRPGQQLVERLEARLTPQDREIIAVETVECLGVCTRPCTLAMAAPGKWTVVLGDFDAEKDVEDLVLSLRLYAASENGRVPKKDRPEAFRRGGVSRTPPRRSEASEIANRTTRYSLFATRSFRFSPARSRSK